MGIIAWVTPPEISPRMVNNPLATRVFHANLTNTRDAATRTMPPGPTTWVMVEACRIHPPLLIHPPSTGTLMPARTHNGEDQFQTNGCRYHVVNGRWAHVTITLGSSTLH